MKVVYNNVSRVELATVHVYATLYHLNVFKVEWGNRMSILDDQARQQMTLYFQLSLQCNVLPITGFVRHTASASTPACLITFMERGSLHTVPVVVFTCELSSSFHLPLFSLPPPSLLLPPLPPSLHAYTCTQDGATVLHFAAGLGHASIVRLLLDEFNIDPDLPDMVGLCHYIIAVMLLIVSVACCTPHSV